ncbi:MAG: hypothetical protein HXY34_02110 [Candidatus Thorarchaeota archaeon]|nr:hypothetical protein [Candidatus Thorarchaeota archaeon]
MLTANAASERRILTSEQVSQLEQLLRDCALDMMAEVEEGVDFRLKATGPFDISLPLTDEDRDRAETGMEDLLEHLE